MGLGVVHLGRERASREAGGRVPVYPLRYWGREMWEPEEKDDDELETKKEKRQSAFPSNTVPSSKPVYPTKEGVMSPELAKKLCREFIERLKGKRPEEEREPGEDEEFFY